MAAVQDGKSLDTSMGFTAAASLPMGTRPGDLDPGVAWYMMQSEHLTPEQFNHIIHRESGLLGVSETSSDVRNLIERQANDVCAAEAAERFCYQTHKWIGTFAAVLGGVETLVFAGGIGENSPEVRARAYRGLGFADSVFAADVDQDGDLDVLGAAPSADDITGFHLGCETRNPRARSSFGQGPLVTKLAVWN